MNLISMEQFQTYRLMHTAYTGFVWEKNGSIYSVFCRPYIEERDTLPYPLDKMPFTRGTKFSIARMEHIVTPLKLKEHFVFDEKGAFIEMKAADTTSNSTCSIYIRKKNSSGFEDVPINQTQLSNEESYIDIFTSILSDFKDAIITPRHLTGPILYLLGQPINALKPVAAMGSKTGSSIASWGLSKLDIKISTKASNQLEKVLGYNIVRNSKNLGRIAGRSVPYLGWVLTAADAIYTSYELGQEYGPMTMSLKRQRKQFEYESVILRDLDEFIGE